MIQELKVKKIILENILPGLILLIIGTFIGVLTTTRNENKRNNHRFIDYKVTIDPEIVQINDDNLKDEIKFTYKNEDIKKLTSVKIRIFNYSDKDFTDVPIYIIIKHSNPELKILNQNYLDQNDLIDGIEFIKSEKDNYETKFYFKIKNASHTVISNKPSFKDKIFSFAFLVLNDNDIEVKVLQNKSGLDIQEFNYYNYVKKPLSQTAIGIIIITFITLIIYLALISFLTRFQKIVFKKKYQLKKEQKISYLTSRLKDDFPTLNDPEDIITKILDFLVTYYWIKGPKFLRHFLSEKPSSIKELKSNHKHNNGNL